jgi:hypothetical protein
MISSPLSWRDLCRPQNCGSSGRKNGSRSYPSYGLSCFHYKELYEWPKSRRSDLIADLCGIIRPYVAAKTGVAVVNREMAAIFSESERKNWRINAYAVAGRTVAREMRLWCQRGSGILPELVYERGDVGQDKLTHLLTSQGYPNPIFKPKKRYVDRKSGIVHLPAVPLQAADLLAYEIFWRMSEYLQTGQKPAEARLCADLENIPGEYGTVERDRLALQRDAMEQHDPDILIPSVEIKTS